MTSKQNSASPSTATTKKRTPKYEHVWDRSREFDGKVYEPEADSFLFLDALDVDRLFLQRLNPAIVVEIGVGSGIVCSHCCLHSLLPTMMMKNESASGDQKSSSEDVSNNNNNNSSSGGGVACIGIDINQTALKATAETWNATRQALLVEEHQQKAQQKKNDDDDDKSAPVLVEQQNHPLHYHHRSLSLIRGDCTSSLRNNVVDVLLFNPPYVPTSTEEMLEAQASALSAKDELPAAWAGGLGGREICDKVLVRIPSLLRYPSGVAYVVAMRENNTEEMLAVVNEAAAKIGRVMDGSAVVSRWTGEHLSIVKFVFRAQPI